MKLLRLILLQTLFFYWLAALNLQASELEFMFENKNNGRPTKIRVKKVEKQGWYFLVVNSETEWEGGGLTHTEIPLNSDGITGEGQENRPLAFSLLTLDLLIQLSQSDRLRAGPVLMPFGSFVDGTVNSNGLLNRITVYPGPYNNNVDEGSGIKRFTILGHLNLGPNEAQHGENSVMVKAIAVYDADNGQLTRFEISTPCGGAGGRVDFVGRLHLTANGEQALGVLDGVWGPESGSDSDDDEDTEDEEDAKDNQPDNSITLPGNIPTNDQSRVVNLPDRTPADQLEPMTDALGIVSPGGAGVDSKSDTEGK